MPDHSTNRWCHQPNAHVRRSPTHLVIKLTSLPLQECRCNYPQQTPSRSSYHIPPPNDTQATHQISPPTSLLPALPCLATSTWAHHHGAVSPGQQQAGTVFETHNDATLSHTWNCLYNLYNNLKQDSFE